jgi:hypothetical protein
MSDEITIAESDLAQLEPQQFAELIATAKDKQLSEIIHGPLRKQVLDEIFGRMAETSSRPRSPAWRRSSTSRSSIAPPSRAAATTTTR